jgi:hypothetical protein
MSSALQLAAGTRRRVPVVADDETDELAEIAMPMAVAARLAGRFGLPRGITRRRRGCSVHACPPILASCNGPALLVAFSGTTGPKDHPALSVASGCQSRKNHVKFYNE